MTPEELNAMPMPMRNCVPDEWSVRTPHGALPWMITIDHTDKENPVRSNILVWTKNEVSAANVANSVVRKGIIRSIEVVNPAHHTNGGVALHVTIPLDHQNDLRRAWGVANALERQAFLDEVRT